MQTSQLGARLETCRRGAPSRQLAAHACAPCVRCARGQGAVGVEQSLGNVSDTRCGAVTQGTCFRAAGSGEACTLFPAKGGFAMLVHVKMM